MTSLGFLGKNRSIVEGDHDSFQVEQNEKNSIKYQIFINFFFSHCHYYNFCGKPQGSGRDEAT